MVAVGVGYGLQSRNPKEATSAAEDRTVVRAGEGLFVCMKLG